MCVIDSGKTENKWIHSNKNYQKQSRFPLAKKRRQHLHQIIDGNRCDLTHVTERRGSPFTLVCTKTTASYEAACKIHERDLQNLSRIIALENKTC